MNENAILQITSSKNSGIGTGFVIESDTNGIVVVTCSHVVSACGSASILVEGTEAVVQNNFAEQGLDLAILYVEGLHRDALVVEEVKADKVKLFGYTQFNTNIRANIKGEWMLDVDAKYDVSLTGEGQSISVIRLSSKHKISSGYSGSPVICEQSGVVVGMVVLEVKENSIESYTNYAISVKHILEHYAFPKQKEPKSLFVSQVFDTLNDNRLVVLFSQDFTNITQNQERLKVTFQEKFKDGFFHFSVPSFLDERSEYFKILAKSCALSEQINSPHAWKVAMQERLKASSARVMLFITDIENGNIEFDKQFAQIIRSLVSEFHNFSALFIGKKDLAYLVYGESSLSPLNIAKELFFPDVTLTIDEELVERQFLSLGKHRVAICKHLKKETLGRHKVWSFNEAINALFWKNLLVKKGKHFAWRDELTKQIGREVYECTSTGSAT